MVLSDNRWAFFSLTRYLEFVTELQAGTVYIVCCVLTNQILFCLIESCQLLIHQHQLSHHQVNTITADGDLLWLVGRRMY